MLACAAGICPTVLHPTVHDEPALHFSIFDQLFRAPDAFAFSTQEEVDLVARRFHLAPRGEVIGIGVDLAACDLARCSASSGRRSPARRISSTSAESTKEKARASCTTTSCATSATIPATSSSCSSVSGSRRSPEHADVLLTGFVDYDVRDSALAGALALVQPSSFESFSMILTEAFAQGRPALVQARSEVLVGHAVRSGAAIPYSDGREFARALHDLVTDPTRAETLGARGRAYVAEHYAWDVVMDRYERLLQDVVHSALDQGDHSLHWIHTPADRPCAWQCCP